MGALKWNFVSKRLNFSRMCKNYYYSMKIFVSIILLLQIYSCNTEIKLEGRYVSQNPFLSTKRYIVGNELIIRSDSTYHYTMCGQIVTGKWKIVDDSLVLVCSTFNYRNDSLNLAIQPYCNTNEIYETFFIDNNNTLISSFHSSKVGRVYNLLKRSDK